MDGILYSEAWFELEQPLADGSGLLGLPKLAERCQIPFVGGRKTWIQFHCPAPSVSWLLVNNAQAAMVLKIRNSTGFNPVGVVVVGVPASGTAVAAATYDRTFYVTTAALGCTIAIAGGPSVVIPASSFAQVFIPAGVAFTPTYMNAPTWVVEGN